MCLTYCLLGLRCLMDLLLLMRISNMAKIRFWPANAYSRLGTIMDLLETDHRPIQTVDKCLFRINYEISIIILLSNVFLVNNQTLVRLQVIN